MNLQEDSLIILRVIGALMGLLIVAHAFLWFRRRRLSRGETAFRWIVGTALTLISVHPPTVNFVVSLLAMESASYGRMLALLVLSSLLLWALVLRERGKNYLLARNFDRLVRSLALHQGLLEQRDRLAGKPILVALPALNEAGNIVSVLQRIPVEIQDRTVAAVVIDDGSTDGTPQVVGDAGYAVVSNPMRRGQGAALRLAYDIAQDIGAEVVVTLDADGQHLPEEIGQVISPILEDRSDFVVGSRLRGQREKDSIVRLLGIHVNNALINMLAGTRISDCSSGFKAIRVASLRKIALAEDQFQAAEAIIAAAHNGLRISEAPITVKRRLSGTSKKGKNLSYGLNFMRTVLKSWWR